MQQVTDDNYMYVRGALDESEFTCTQYHGLNWLKVIKPMTLVYKLLVLRLIWREKKISELRVGSKSYKYVVTSYNYRNPVVKFQYW